MSAIPPSAAEPVEEPQTTLQNDALAAVTSVAVSLDQFDTLHEMLTYALDRVLDVVGTEAGSVYLLNDAQDELDLELCKGLPKEVFDDFNHLRVGEGLAGRVAVTGESVFVDNLADDPRLTRVMARTEQLRGFAAVPLKTPRRIYGTLNVHTRSRRQFSRDDMHVLTSIGVQIGYAIESVRLYRDLQASEQKFRSLVEAARDLIFKLDANGDIAYVNPIVSSLLGYTPEEIYSGQTRTLDLVHPADRDRMAGRFREMLNGQVFSGLEYRAATKGAGEVRWLSLTNYPLLESGRIVGVQATARDVTDRKELQARVVRAERLADLGQLAAGIAHEVRNPLSAIMNAASLLRQDLQLSDEDGRLLTVILEETDRLGKVVGDVLTFARPAEPDFAACDLHHVLNLVVHAFGCDERLGQKTRIHLSVPRDLPPVHADANHLRQVVWNVLKNAVEASAPGGDVEVSVQQDRKSATDLLVSITDHGCGIGPDMLGRVFQPFTTTKADGTGLGLSIVQAMVERHGGTIAIESEPGVGTRVSIGLRLNPCRDT